MFVEIRVRSGTNWANYSILRRFRELSWDTKYLDAGALNIGVPVSDAQALGLADLSVVEVAPNGQSILDGWYYIDATSGTRVADDELWTTFSGKGLVAMLDEARVYPSSWGPCSRASCIAGNPAHVQADHAGNGMGACTKCSCPMYLGTATPAGHAFLNASAGTIVQTLVARAQQRGTITWLDVTSFTGTTTSGGVGWSANITRNFDAGTGLWAVLTELATLGMVSWRMNGRALQLYNLDEAACITTRTPEVAAFRRGQAMLDQSTNTDSSSMASTALVVGDQNQVVERTSTTNFNAIGRRREIYVAQSGITDIPTLQMIGDRNLSLEHLKTEESVGVTDDTKPWVNYLPGDWVWEDTAGTLAKIQVMQIAAAAQEESTVKIALTLGDRLDANDAKTARILDAITNGGGAVPSPVTNDAGIPSPPTGVNPGTPNAYRDGNGHDFAQVTLAWIAPTTNTDGSPLTDLGHYDVQYQVGGGSFTGATTIDPSRQNAYYSGLQPGTSVVFRVRAVDNAGNASAWANSSPATMPAFQTGPPMPSTPTLSPAIRALVVGWDGNDSTGAAMPSSWSYTEVHVSTTSNFTPGYSGGNNTLQGHLSSRGGRLYVAEQLGGAFYAKLVAVDKTGLKGPASAQNSSSVAVPAIANADLGPKAVDAAKIGDGVIYGSNLALGAFGDSVVLNPGFEDVATAPEDAGTGCAHWKVIYATGSSASRDTATFAGGSASLHCAIGAGSTSNIHIAGSAGGNANVVPAVPTSLGDIWYMKFKARASVAGQVQVMGRLALSVDANHTASLFDSNNPWQVFTGDGTYDANNNWSPTGNGPNLPLDNSGLSQALDVVWNTYEGSLTVPSGPGGPLIYARPILSVNTPTNQQAIDVWFDDVTLMPVKGTAFLPSAAIGSAQISSLTADKVVAGALTVGDITANTVSGGTLFSGGDIVSTDIVFDASGGTLLVYAVSAGTTVDLNTPGSGSWSNPAGTGNIKVECWGGGGAGICGQATYGGGPGGSGGEYAVETFVKVFAGQNYSYVVGAGGVGTAYNQSPNNDGPEGGLSSFQGDLNVAGDGKGVYVMAHGGNGAFGGTVMPGGTGSNNSTHFNGGKNNVGGSAFHRGGNSGGSSAGNNGSGYNGNSTNGNTGAAAPKAANAGGAGGAGGTGSTTAGGTHAAGASGQQPGGGGGGGGSNGGTGTANNGNGGSGGAGRVRITYGATYQLIASIAASVGGPDAYGFNWPQGVSLGATAVAMGYSAAGSHMAWTPQLTSTGNNPTGWSCSGSFAVIGRLCFWDASIIASSGFTTGTGAYIISLPIAPAVASVWPVGWGQVTNSDYTYFCCVDTTSGNNAFCLVRAGTAPVVREGSSGPYYNAGGGAWGTNNTIRCNGVYRF
jgi:hypothetical protein